MRCFRTHETKKRNLHAWSLKTNCKNSNWNEVLYKRFSSEVIRTEATAKLKVTHFEDKILLDENNSPAKVLIRDSSRQIAYKTYAIVYDKHPLKVFEQDSRARKYGCN